MKMPMNKTSLLTLAIILSASAALAEPSQMIREIPETFGGTPVTDRQVLSSVLTIDGDCSGFLIATNYAITAGHCTASTRSKIKLNHQTCSVLSVSNPPDADADHNRGDFTLMKIKCPTLAATHTFFSLPAQDQTFTGAVQIAGFGSSDGSALVTNLAAVPATLTTNYNAIATRAGSANDYTLLLSAANDGADICMLETPRHVEYHGDSGGPVYVKSGQKYTAIGAVSIGLTSDESDAPTARFAMCGPRLANYTNWIHQQMGAL